jgi:hypothetical protein
MVTGLVWAAAQTIEVEEQQSSPTWNLEFFDGPPGGAGNSARQDRTLRVSGITSVPCTSATDITTVDYSFLSGSFEDRYRWHLCTWSSGSRSFENGFQTDQAETDCQPERSIIASYKIVKGVYPQI